MSSNKKIRLVLLILRILSLLVIFIVSQKQSPVTFEDATSKVLLLLNGCSFQDLVTTTKIYPYFEGSLLSGVVTVRTSL